MSEMNKLTSRIFIDADACPVKSQTINVATRHKLEVYIVSNGGIKPNPNELIKTVVVDIGPDVADNWIVNNIYKNDIVITTDILLAERSVKHGAHVILHNGDIINQKNIGEKIASRNLMSEIRSANPFYLSKGKVYSKSDKIKYVNSLEKIIQTIKKSL